MADKTGIGPCDKCGSDDDCRCGPCMCQNCQYDRGEADFETRLLVEANIKAHRMADQRQELRASAKRMGEKIAALDGVTHDGFPISGAA